MKGTATKHKVLKKVYSFFFILKETRQRSQNKSTTPRPGTWIVTIPFGLKIRRTPHRWLMRRLSVVIMVMRK